MIPYLGSQAAKSLKSKVSCASTAASSNGLLTNNVALSDSERKSLAKIVA